MLLLPPEERDVSAAKECQSRVGTRRTCEVTAGRAGRASTARSALEKKEPRGERLPIVKWGSQIRKSFPFAGFLRRDWGGEKLSVNFSLNSKTIVRRPEP